MATQCHVRSISLPSRSHPATFKIKQELNKLRTWDASSSSRLGTICSGLSGLQDLYKCLDELLVLPSTQQALSHHQHEKWVNELLDGPVRLLDICGTVRDLISQFKDNVRDLQSALRRRKGDFCIESGINNYICARRKMSKDAKKLLATMKKMDSKTGASPLLDQDHQIPTGIGVLREVNSMSFLILESLLVLLSTPVLKSKASGWSLISRYMHKQVVSCEGKYENAIELDKIDFAVSTLAHGRADLEKMQIAHKGMGILEAGIESLGNGLECMFRYLIKTRASLLNAISHVM